MGSPRTRKVTGTDPKAPVLDAYANGTMAPQHTCPGQTADMEPRDALVQAPSSPGARPWVLNALADWSYLERSVHRMLCGWTRAVPEWEGKAATHRQIWDQADVVRRLRERMAQFPGGRSETPVSSRLERLANAALLAPTVEDALDGIHSVLNSALLGAYAEYMRRTHPVHDQPTVRVLHEIAAIKEQHRLWWRERRRRNPHAMDAGYRGGLQRALTECGDLFAPLPVEGVPARPTGVGTLFQLPERPARLPEYRAPHDLLPFLRVDFPRNVEARRLFWALGYMLEMNLPEEQVRWIYDSPDMPWDFHYDVSRHLWDESRHGESGLSRLQDFGIQLGEVGFANPGGAPALHPLSPKELHDGVFFITMVAETGHFRVKNEACQDFRDGGDLESAEMMLFDVVDETTHVQYGHRWLPVLAERAGMKPYDYHQQSAAARRAKQQEEDAHRARIDRELNRSPSNPAFALYLDLLERMRRRQPLSNATTCPPRSPLPM